MKNIEKVQTWQNTCIELIAEFNATPTARMPCICYLYVEVNIYIGNLAPRATKRLHFTNNSTSALQPHIGTSLLLQLYHREWDLWYCHWDLIEARSYTQNKMTFAHILVNSYLHAWEGGKEERNDLFFSRAFPRKGLFDAHSCNLNAWQL